MHIIVGTAGHIDHGKTALIKALTGIDADRLPEEKQRGITIDLGFAELDLGDVRIGFVDVPGHERFVKNMLAGASGIDLVLLVIAANEGVMPQTREHFEICRMLAIKAGIVVITKAELADEELLELVKLETAELVENSFLETAPVVAVSAKTGVGIDELNHLLAEAASNIAGRTDQTVTRLPIDRSFTVKGFGAVVTGTLVSGQISESDEMELLPIGRKVRVRGLQTHNTDVKTVFAGQRAAVNLGGIDQREIERGMLLSERGILRPTQIINAEIEVLKDAKKELKNRQRVRVHIGTVEALARILVLNTAGEIKPGASDFVQVRLETPIAAIPGDRFIIRSYSPQVTVGGGRVLEALAAKLRKKDIENARKFLHDIVSAKDDIAAKVRLWVEASNENGINFNGLQARTGLRKGILQQSIAENLRNGAIVEAEGFFIARGSFEELKSKALAEIEDHHRRQPLSKGTLRETLREQVFGFVKPEIFTAVISDLEIKGKIAAENDIVRLAGHRTELSADEMILRNKLTTIYKNAGVEVPKLDDALEEAIRNSPFKQDHARKIFQLLLNDKDLVKVSEEFYFSGGAIDDLLSKMQQFASGAQDRLIDVAQFKEIAGVSRKYAIPLLEYFDREKKTRRAGDKRIVL